MSGVELLLAAGATAAAEAGGAIAAGTVAAGAAAGAPLSLAAPAAGAAAGLGTLGTLGTLGEIAGIGGSLLSGYGALKSGQDRAAAERAEALQIERKAGEERAASQRNAERKRQQTQIVLSRQQAVAAASGGSATDPTVLDLMAGVTGEGELQASAIQYEGEERSKGLDYQAAIKKMVADNAKTAGVIGAGTSVLSGLNSWARYRRNFYRGGGDSYADN